MLFELLSICVLGGVIYYVSRKTWHTDILFYVIKYNILGMLAVTHDLWNARYNKTGKI